MSDQGSTNGAHGGVGHLLRMAKTQCGVSLAFAALRKADGGFAIATFPTLMADPTWSVEAIDELVRQTWEDPHLSGGSVLVRSGRVLKGMWTGQGHHIKLAAAALSDPDAPEQPWGLLCVAEPLAGHFEQDQLNLLGNLAVRLTSYLRARQQVLEGSLDFQPTETHAAAQSDPTHAPEPAYEPMVETPVVTEAQRAPTIADSTPFIGYVDPDPAPSSPFDHLFGDEDDLHPLDRAADTFEETSTVWGAPETRHARSDDWDFLGIDEIEWVEAVAPTPAPPAEGQTNFTDAAFEAPTPDPWALGAPEFSPPTFEAPPAEHELFTEPAAEATAGPSTFGTREDAPGPSAPPLLGGELDSLLGPDPVTGLATLTTLVGRLSTSLAHVRNNEGTVGLILVDVSTTDGAQPLSTTALMTVAGRLTNHLRERDMVARIGPALFAVLVDLRPGSIDLDVIRERSLLSLHGETEANTTGLETRTAVASATAGSSVTAEDLIRQAAEKLRTR
ncbi:MAG: GGDEF domain-containing protein [Acidimicrobiales bacterium]